MGLPPQQSGRLGQVREVVRIRAAQEAPKLGTIISAAQQVSFLTVTSGGAEK